MGLFDFIKTKMKNASQSDVCVKQEGVINTETAPASITPEKIPNGTNFNQVKLIDGFPEFDDKGMKILKVLDNVLLTGVTKKFNDINPQDTIEMLSDGEEVFFKRVPMKKYPNAVLVTDCSDNPIGWIPEDFVYQEDIAKRLDDGTTVLGDVSSIWGGENGKSYGISINIARYSKKRVSKK